MRSSKPSARLLLIFAANTAHRVARENPIRRTEEQQRNTIGRSSNKLVFSVTLVTQQLTEWPVKIPFTEWKNSSVTPWVCSKLK